MGSVRDTLWSGVVATFVVSAMMIMKNATGSLPEIHIAHTLSELAGAPNHVMVGWAIHLFIGIVLWSTLYAVLAPRLPTRSYIVKGLAFGILAWLAMMLIYMPLAGAGPFGLHRSVSVPIATLVMHLVYGLVLGAVYGMGVSQQSTGTLQRVSSRETRTDS